MFFSIRLFQQISFLFFRVCVRFGIQGLGLGLQQALARQESVVSFSFQQ